MLLIQERLLGQSDRTGPSSAHQGRVFVAVLGTAAAAGQGRSKVLFAFESGGPGGTGRPAESRVAKLGQTSVLETQEIYQVGSQLWGGRVGSLCTQVCGEWDGGDWGDSHSQHQFLGHLKSPTFLPGVPCPAPSSHAWEPDVAPQRPHRSGINIPLRFSKVYFTSKL